MDAPGLVQAASQYGEDDEGYIDSLVQASQDGEADNGQGITRAHVAEGNPLLMWSNPALFRSKSFEPRPFEAMTMARRAFQDKTSKIVWNFSSPKEGAVIEPSWKRMYPTQPPCAMAKVRYHSWARSKNLSAEAGEGVKLGQFAEAFKDLALTPGARLFCTSGWVEIEGVVFQGCHVVHEGIEKFKRIEDQIGRAKALKLGCVQPPLHIHELLQGRNMDILIERGAMDAIVNGANVSVALMDYELSKVEHDEGWVQ